jgi:hypothetical protein
LRAFLHESITQFRDSWDFIFGQSGVGRDISTSEHQKVGIKREDEFVHQHRQNSAWSGVLLVRQNNSLRGAKERHTFLSLSRPSSLVRAMHANKSIQLLFLQNRYRTSVPRRLGREPTGWRRFISIAARPLLD